MKQYFRLLFCTAVIFNLVSCKKSNTEDAAITIPNAETPISEIATYKLILTGEWQMPQHTVPPGNHFTKFVGMVHGNNSAIWHLGQLASIGVENVAEVGNDASLNAEIDAHISSGKALNRFSIILPTIMAKDSAYINVDIAHSLISLESMIAPSPDWFAGVDSYNLIQAGKWVSDVTVNIYGYDAGTEDGDVFGYSNPPTVPQQAISFLSPANASVIANGNTMIAPFATIRLIRQ